ncbi:MAG: hypothetical protein LC789_02735 [Actinobacteria bacterium]|nr:hypothetical protein [Actinomycetota bacterium]MCA1721737.1 hypothetical protein [Actinomycetota bacterium]
MLRNRPGRGAVLLAVAATLGTAACGSTVPSTGAASTAGGAGLTASGPGDDGVSAPAAGAANGLGGFEPGAQGSAGGSNAEAGPITGSLDGSVSGSGPTTPTGSRTTASGGTASGGALPPRASAQGVGVTATTVNIGITYTENAKEANAAFGVNISPGDTRANAQAILDDINARGGVAGRKLVPVFHAYDAQSAETNAEQDQAACEDLTQDHKVFAAVGGGGDTWDACMKKAGVLNTVGATLTESDRTAIATKSNYFNANAPVRDRVEGSLVPALVRQKYFSGWDINAGGPGSAKPVVGILGYDLPEWDRPLKNVLLPKLKAAGQSVLPENIARISAPQSQAEQGPAIAEVQNAVLRFRNNGVTHLIIIDTGGGLTLVFTTNSKNQNYYPRLGVTSGSGLQGLYDAGTFTDRELAGAVGVGWAPSIDLPSKAGDAYANAATKRCLAVLKERTGQQYATTNEASVALGQCDEINLVAEAIRRAGSVITLSGAVSALEAAGDDIVLASRPRSFFGPGRHDGSELGWDMVWDTPCKCAKYVGTSRPMRE